MCIPCSKIFNAVPSNMIFDVGTLTLKFDLLYKTIDGDYDFWITGYILLLFTYGCCRRAMLSFWQLWLCSCTTWTIPFVERIIWCLHLEERATCKDHFIQFLFVCLFSWDYHTLAVVLLDYQGYRRQHTCMCRRTLQHMNNIFCIIQNFISDNTALGCIILLFTGKEEQVCSLPYICLLLSAYGFSQVEAKLKLTWAKSWRELLSYLWVANF